MSNNESDSHGPPLGPPVRLNAHEGLPAPPVRLPGYTYEDPAPFFGREPQDYVPSSPTCVQIYTLEVSGSLANSKASAVDPDGIVRYTITSGRGPGRSHVVKNKDGVVLYKSRQQLTARQREIVDVQRHETTHIMRSDPGSKGRYILYPGDRTNVKPAVEIDASNKERVTIKDIKSGAERGFFEPGSREQGTKGRKVGQVQFRADVEAAELLAVVAELAL